MIVDYKGREVAYLFFDVNGDQEVREAKILRVGGLDSTSIHDYWQAKDTETDQTVMLTCRIVEATQECEFVCDLRREADCVSQCMVDPHDRQMRFEKRFEFLKNTENPMYSLGSDRCVATLAQQKRTRTSVQEKRAKQIRDRVRDKPEETRKAMNYLKTHLYAMSKHPPANGDYKRGVCRLVAMFQTEFPQFAAY